MSMPAAQNWTPYSRRGLCSVEGRGRIPPLYLLAMLFLTQLRVPLAAFATRVNCWPAVNLLATRTTRSLSAKLISSWSVPSIYWCLGQILLRGRTLGVPLLIFVRFLLARFSNLLNDCTLFWYISYSFQFSIICKLAEGALCLTIQVINEGAEQDLSQY